MPENQYSQFKELALKSRKILLTTAKRHTGDGLSALLALTLILRKINKNSEIVIDGYKQNNNLSFLPLIEEIKSSAKNVKKFTVSVNIAQTGIENLSYDISGDTLRIHLNPIRGEFEPKDVNLGEGEFAYDLIVVVGATRLEDLGNMYDFHRDIFYKVPVVNIDNSIDNEQFGHLNIFEITSASVSEIIYKIALFWLESEIDNQIATCLLTGIISSTKSFKTSNVTPKIMQMASDLMNLGANRKEIVAKLFQNKTVPMLKLWGKILSRLQADFENKIFWSKADLHDFTESGAGEADVPAVIEELIFSCPQAQVVALFYQIATDETKVIIASQTTMPAVTLGRIFNASGDNKIANFKVDGLIQEVEKNVMEEIRLQLKNIKQL